jgi:hypothetical protein
VEELMDKLKFDGIVKIGDKIRAYDFEPMEGRGGPYFVEGIVEGTDESYTHGHYKFFVVRCLVDSMAIGEHSRVGEIVFVPYETSFDYDNRVTVID